MSFARFFQQKQQLDFLWRQHLSRPLTLSTIAVGYAMPVVSNFLKAKSKLNNKYISVDYIHLKMKCVKNVAQGSSVMW